LEERDARLVALNARDAADRGADIATRTRFVAARRQGGEWRLTLEDQRSRARFEITARALVNAAGPWVSDVVQGVVGLNSPSPTRLVKGSHIVVERLFDHDRAYIFQNADGRICFAIPYEQDFTLIGTTDEDFHGDPATVAITDGETDYLLAAVSEYLATPVTRDRIRWTYAGVRPLYDDGASKAQEATRDYVLSLDAPDGEPPLLSVFGGKITTYRRLAEEALAHLAGTFPHMRGGWTRTATLPGGDIKPTLFGAWEGNKRERYPFLEPRLVWRLCRAYGTRVDFLLSDVERQEDMGIDFGAGLSQREVDYLVANEWAETAEDILWRRSKLGLHIGVEGRAALEAYLARGREKPQAVGAQ
jgi:glycerol-3-phosphate dehydrogenase